MKKLKTGKLTPIALLTALILIAYEFYQEYSHKDLNAKVVNVSDGDSFRAIIDGETQRVRLSDIDCPEKNQPYGNKAKLFTSDLIKGQHVYVHIDGKDRYGRILGTVFLEDGTNLNEELVKNRLAWHYKEYSSKQEFAHFEKLARMSGKGLRSQKKPVAPWTYRKNKRKAQPAAA